MQHQVLLAGERFPELLVYNQDNTKVDISQPNPPADWKLVVVYRGKHCPLCTKYLNELENHLQTFKEIGVDVAAVSGDSAEQLNMHLEKLQVSFPLFYGLTIQQMQSLGGYISHPRSEKETDHPFPEPGMFVINQDGNLQVVDISNNPFSRPHLEAFVSGLKYIRENDYPIRGTFEYTG